MGYGVRGCASNPGWESIWCGAAAGDRNITLLENTMPCHSLTPQTSPPHLSRCLQIHKLGLFDPKEGQGLRDLYSSKALQLTFMQESEDVLQQVSRKMGKTRNDGIKSQCCCSISKL